MADRTGWDSTMLHYLTTSQATVSICRPVILKITLNYSLTWQTDHCAPCKMFLQGAIKCQSNPFLDLVLQARPNRPLRMWITFSIMQREESIDAWQIFVCYIMIADFQSQTSIKCLTSGTEGRYWKSPFQELAMCHIIRYVFPLLIHFHVHTETYWASPHPFLCIRLKWGY